MHHIFRKYTFRLFSAVIAVVTLTGCVYDNDVCPGDVPDPGVSATDISIRFNITSNLNSNTRAADLDGEQAGFPPENYIDVSSMQFLLFDSEQKFLRFLSPEITEDAANGQYIALANFREPQFDDITEGDVTFYIMALANGSSMGAPWVGAVRGTTTIADLCAARQNSTLTAVPSPSQLLYADYVNLQKIPMSGLQNFTVSVDELKASTEDNPVDLSASVTGRTGRTLYLLRALAKIEIIDKVNYTGNYTEALADNPDRIDKVELDGFFSRGNQLPAYNQWMRGDVTLPETQQVIAPSIPQNFTYNMPPVFDPDNDKLGIVPATAMMDFVYDSYATEARADKAPVYSGYVYEHNFPLDGVAVERQPFLRITTLGTQNISGSSRVLPFRLGTYQDGAFQAYYNQLLRNHIYRLEIVKITPENTVVALSYGVCPWEEKGATIPDFN